MHIIDYCFVDALLAIAIQAEEEDLLIKNKTETDDAEFAKILQINENKKIEEEEFKKLQVGLHSSSCKFNIFKHALKITPNSINVHYISCILYT